MALTINTNVASLNAQRNLSSSQSKLAKSMERLSTGMRINSGQDDAAGLAISSRMTGQIRGLNQAVRNAGDGISMAKTAEGGLKEIGNMLQRMRELAVQKENGALSASDKSAITTEMDALNTEIGNIKGRTKFNDVELLTGTTATVTFQVGAETGESYTLSLANVSAAPGAGATLAAIDTAIDNVSKVRGDFGTAMTALEAHAANAMTAAENLSAARSRIQDADIAKETAAMTRQNILQQAGVSILAQANQAPNMVMSLLQG